ncbi:MAG: response regulator [Candidatus Anammoxibacter sp.]
MAHFMSVVAKKKGVNLMVRYEPDAPVNVIGDSGRIRQILTNLASNAIKFTKKGHVMIDVQRLSSENEKADFRFRIVDTGIGIAPDKIERIFDKFTQEDNTTTRKYGGTGLGLAICKQLVRLMDGNISVKSKMGEGSVFEFTIPLAIDSSNEKVEKTPNVDLAGLRILIIDDSSINRQIYTELLTSWRINCSAVESGKEALLDLRSKAEGKKPYQIALVDFFMPGMDAETLTKSIKSDPLIKETLLIMLTSGSKSGTLKQMNEIGFAAYLEKPVRRAELKDMLAVVWAGFNKGMTSGMISLQMLQNLKAKRHRLFIEKRPETINFNAHILLVEDNTVNQDVAMENLQLLGCSVDLARNGMEAVQMIKENRFSLVFMDCQMPVMDGYEATRLIREYERPGNYHTKIVAMTAGAMRIDRERCLNAGMDDYLSKPVRQQALIDVLVKYCEYEKGSSAKDKKALVVNQNRDTLDRISQMIRDLAVDNTLPKDDFTKLLSGVEKVINSFSVKAAEPLPDTDDEYCPASDKHIFSISATLALVGGKVERMKRLIDMTLEDSEKLMETLRESIEKGDVSGAERAAHSLKGHAAYIGANTFRDLAERIEHMAKDGNIESIQKMMANFKKEYKILTKALIEINWDELN